MFVLAVTALTGWAEAAPTYTLTVSVNNEQGAKPNGSGQYEAGQKVYVYVNVSSDYELVKWTEDGKDIDTDVTKTGFQYVMPDHDVELTAHVNYAPKTPGDPSIDRHIYHTLTVVTQPANARVNTDTYHLEVGKKQTLGYPTPADYRFLGWYLNGELVAEPGNYEFTMPDHDITLERRYVYDPTVPANPGANTWYLIDDGTVELIIDDFQPGGVSAAVEKAQRLHKFDYDNVTSLIVKGKVYETDFSSIYRLGNLLNVDFTRSDLEHVRDHSWNKTGLTTVKLPSSVKKIDSYAFSNCLNLKNVVCLALTPPEVNSTAFYGNHEGAFLYVPAASVELYQEAAVWKDFIIYPLTDELASLNVTLPLACADGRCKDMRLEVVNAKSGVRQKYIITDRMTYTYDLVYDCIYHVRLVSQKGEILSQVENINLGHNTIDVTLPDLKPLYDVALQVVQNNGTDVTDEVTAKWYDANGNYVASGQQLTQLTEGYQIAVDVTLPEALARVCQLPQRVEYTVTDKDNNIIVNLQPLAQKTLAALVVNDDGGAYLNNAWVQVTQTVNGRYNHNASGTTDSYGVKELTLYSDVPATLTVSLDGYYTESVNIDNIADLEALPTMRLKPFKGTTIALLMNGYDDYKDLTVSIYDNTKEAAVSDARLQYPYLVLPENVDESDVLAITAHSLAGRFVDVTQTMTVSDLKVAFDIVANGSLEAIYQNNQNGTVRAMIYNGNGHLVDAKACESHKATFSYLPTGSYTVVMMGSSQLFEGISNLSDLGRLGLTEKNDYVKQTVSVQQGETSVADFASVPLFVEGKFSYISNIASYICTSANPRNGYAATFRAAIDFKENYREGISNLRLVVDYDDRTEFVKGSVVLNTKLHDYAQGEQSVEIDGLANGDEVKFCLMPVEDGLMTTTAYVEFDYNGQHLRQPLGTVKAEVSSVVLVIPEVTPQPELNINLKNIPYGKYDKVEFYDNGVLIGTIPDLSSTASYYVGVSYYGGYSAKGNRATLRCKLHDPYYYSYHNIQARLTDTDGKLLLTETKTVQYDPFAAVLSDMGVYCSDNKNGLNMGTISRSNSGKRIYCGRPKWSNGDGYVNLTYYGHFLHNDYMPNLVKNVKLTKFISNDKTQSWYMGLWGDLPNENLSLHDDIAYDFRYLQYGEKLNNDRKVFLSGESCRLDRTPRNMTITFEYNEDFERQEDVANNNRFVKGMKAAMAEQNKLIKQFRSVTQEMNAELAKSEPNRNYFKTLADKSKEIIKKLTGVEEPAITEEQKQLIDKLMTESTPDAEREEIWNKLFPDLTQTKEYSELLQWNQDMMTSNLYIPPYEIREGIWTPSFTYIVGNPVTGNILEDMSDGNWHLDKSQIDYNVFKYVFVNDKGGDRFIIDYSDHVSPNGVVSQAGRRRAGSPSAGDYFQSMMEAAGVDIASWGLGHFTEKGVSSFLTRNVANQLNVANSIYEVSLNTYLSKPNTKWTGKMLDDAAVNLVKTQEAAANTELIAKNAKNAGSVVSVVATIGIVAYNSNKGWKEKSKNNAKWDQLINFVENNCGNDKDLLDILKQNKENEDDHDFWNNIYGSTATATASCLISLLVPKAGDVTALAMGGVDVALAKNDVDMKAEFKSLYDSSVRAISMTKGCEHIIGCLPTNDDFTVQVLIDPSGYVYEAVPSNRIEGATASCYYKDSIQNEYGDWEVKEVLWDAENYENQVNPQITNVEGRYGWDVPQGWWQVRYQKDGYEPARSEWLPVPPPQLEVNIPMIQRSAPEISMAHVYQDGIELLFSKYMQPETLTPEQLKVKVVRGGKETLLSDVKVELLNEEAEAKNSATTFASYLKLTSETGWEDADEVMLIVDRRVKSYCGVPMQEDYMQRLDVEMRIEKIEAEPQLQMAVDESRELNIAVVPAEAGAGKTLRLTPSFAEMMELSADEVVLDADGKATVSVTGKAIGSTSVTLTIDGEQAEEVVTVEVLDTENLFVKAPEASLASGSVLKSGTTVMLTSATPGAQIYYTTDGSCPCDETSARMLYTEPIAITGETVLKAQAVKDGWYDSEVVTFVYDIDPTTGIKDINNSADEGVKQFYDLQGRKVGAGQKRKGLYIMVGADGRTRKTVVK